MKRTLQIVALLWVVALIGSASFYASQYTNETSNRVLIKANIEQQAEIDILAEELSRANEKISSLIGAQ